MKLQSEIKHMLASYWSSKIWSVEVGHHGLFVLGLCQPLSERCWRIWLSCNVFPLLLRSIELWLLLVCELFDRHIESLLLSGCIPDISYHGLFIIVIGLFDYAEAVWPSRNLLKARVVPNCRYLKHRLWVVAGTENASELALRVNKSTFINNLHVIENQTPSDRLPLRIFKQLRIQVLLALRLVGKYIPDVVEKSQTARWYNHAASLRSIVMSARWQKRWATRSCRITCSHVIIRLVIWVRDGRLPAEFFQLAVGLEHNDRAVKSNHH